MTKQVQLSDKAYEALRASKRRGESFSQTVLRLTGARKDPRSFIGRGASELSLDAHLALAEQLRGPKV